MNIEISARLWTYRRSFSGSDVMWPRHNPPSTSSAVCSTQILTRNASESRSTPDTSRRVYQPSISPRVSTPSVGASGPGRRAPGGGSVLAQGPETLADEPLGAEQGRQRLFEHICRRVRAQVVTGRAHDPPGRTAEGDAGTAAMATAASSERISS